MPSPVFAPDVATYATRVPYVTTAEFVEGGTGVDTSQLVPGGNTAANTAALQRTILRASGWADTLTHKVLAATLDTQAGFYRVQPDGGLQVPVTYTPLIAVTDVALGANAWSLTSLPDLSRVGMDDGVVYLGVRSGGLSYNGSLNPRTFVKITYINGWANSATTASASSGASSISVANPLGIMPGSVLQIDDGSASEIVTVAASYTPVTTVTTTAVALAAPLASPHNAGVAVSGMPQAVKEAVILLTATLIKTRGAQAVVMAGMRQEPTTTALTEAGGLHDYEVACELLKPHRRVW